MESLENIAERISTTKKSLEEHPRQNLEIAIKELLEWRIKVFLFPLD